MAYDYEIERPKVFTDEGQRKFLKVRDHVHCLLDKAGAVRMQEAMSATSGDSWVTLACVDRLVELGEIREITDSGDVLGQHRVFVKVGE